jgi:Ca2+-binding RTX toxin-like protein
MATSFTVNKADLEFILKQIKIAEATSLGYTSTPLTIQQSIMQAYGLSAADAAIAPYGLRTVDGTFNSLVAGQSRLGAADTLFPRLTDPVYRNDLDGDTMPLGPPGSGAPTITNTNYGAPGSVADADPRIISNLVVDMSVDNPAAIEAFLNNPLSVAYYTEKYGVEPTPANLLIHPITNEDLQTIPNQSPDIGLSPGFNAWMTFFGQFFDHGLDLVTKGNNGTVYVPLQADDPLFDRGADGIANTADDGPNFMALTRATPTMVDPDGAGPLPAVAQHTNTTTSFVDQNQTYTSHPSHQAFLREYTTVAGKTVVTGRFLDGSAASGSVDGAIGNWAEVKAEALRYLGINLNDFDVLNVPLLLTDQYGKFIPGPNGYAQIVMAPDAIHPTVWYREGNPDGSVTTAGSMKTNHAFLDDIAHHAVPGFWDDDNNPMTAKVAQTADVDPGVGDDGLAGTYDDEMLNAHFVTGDGRGNENAALTTVHSIFHSEHNRLVEANKSTILATGDLAFINEWLLVDVNAVPATPVEIAALTWDGERLFQAARFGTEMQYQHLVFEEFARRIQPMVDPFIFNSSPDVDPTIVAEFAHTVYRFGHSMLTGTVDRLDNNLDPLDPLDPNSVEGQQTLLAMFLNPQAYIGSGATLEEINANIIRGLSRDVGNALDEFIVTDVRSNLLGLPLDLAVLNIARGRDTGIPSLNQARAQLYNDTGLADLKPYTSWTDFALNIKNAASIINFIAAYGTHDTITTATTLADKRAAAEKIVFNTAGAPADRLDFLNGTGAYAADLGGLNGVDFWLGGLAEKSPEFGGMLGMTFNFVFESQMENLQNGDRLYYLTRTQGLNFLNQLEPNSFADMVMRNTNLGDIYSTHINGQLFVTPDHIIELDRGIAQTDYNGTDPGIDPTWDGSNPALEAILGPKVVRDYTGSTVVDGTHDFGGYLRVQGGEHYVLGGTEGNDRIWGDSGIDALWGDGGDDYLNGMTESDDVFGGEGDDVIEDPFGDDVLRGMQGNDVITTARGADLVFGGEGKDAIILGQDASEVFGGTETDFILGGNGKDFILGNEGDDWIEGGGGFDTIAGENSDLFFNSPIVGHDVMFGHGDEQDYDAESGDDIMGSGPSVYRYEGMFGFDWGMAKYDNSEIRFDLQIPIFTTTPEDVLRDRFDQVEALSGWKNGDQLDGDDRGHSGGSSAPDSVPTQLFTDHVLTTEGIDRITGLRQLLGGTANSTDPIEGIETLFGAGKTTFRDGNILIGGDGNDFLRGRGGYDILDGDAWLNVRIKIVIPDGPYAGTYSAESMTTDTNVMGPNAGKVFHVNADGSPDFSSVAFGGRSLNSLLLDRTINPGDMSIVREILYDDTNVTGAGQNVDTAVFQGGNLEYEIEGTTIQYGADGVATGRTGTIGDVDGDGFIKVKDLDDGLVAAPGRPGNLTVSRGALTDDTDLLKNIERLQFADGTIDIGGTNQLATGTVTIFDATPFNPDGNPATDPVVSPIVGQVLTATLSSFADLDGIPLDANGTPVGLTFEWQTTEAGNDGGWATISTGLTYTVRPVDPAHVLRAVAVFKDASGVTERIASASTDNVTAPFVIPENSPAGTVVAASIPFSLDYDPLGAGGTGATDGDIVNLTHVIAPGGDAGGRFEIVTVGGVQQLRVKAGAPPLDFENTGDAAVGRSEDHSYQIVINTYTDTDLATLVAARQFTVQLTDVEPENIPATGVPTITGPENVLTADTSGMTDANGLGAFNYRWELSTGVNWTPISGATGQSFTIPAALANQMIRVVVSFTDLQGFSESVASEMIAKVGNNANVVEIIDGTAGPDLLNGRGGNDTINGLGGNDTINGSGGNDTLSGGDGNDAVNGGAGADTIDGGIGDDTIDGGIQNDIITGGAGSDTIAGGDGNDNLTGGSGNDALDGGAGTADVAMFAGPITDYDISLNASGQMVVASASEGTDTLTGIERLSIGGTLYTNLARGTNAADAALLGGAGTQILMGFDGNDSIVGGAGNDAVHGGAGDDTIAWAAGDGRDIVNGGTEGAAGDTFAITGAAGAETFRIYTRNAATASIGYTGTAEIVITRAVGAGAAAIIAELSEIEEITVNAATASPPGGPVNTNTGGDTIQVFGNFSETSLSLNTITIDGSSGNDTIDISALSSAHRIVFKSNGGNDTIIGNLRPQDVIVLPNGATAADYSTTTAANGLSTMTHGSNSITFTGMPQVDNDDEGGDDNGNQDDNDDDECGCEDDDDTDTTDGPGTNAPATGVIRTGTPMADVLTGTAGDDSIVGFAGDDVATGDAGADAISVGEGADLVNGGDGRDVVFAGAGDDQVLGGGQADVIYGDAGADRILGDGGNDLVNAGAGEDAVFGGAGDDLIVAELGDGNDSYFGDDSDGGGGVDTLDMSAATASVTVNLGSGPMSNGTASSSQTGNDTIRGIENVNTGSGNDSITASNAVNLINAGAGNDTITFTSASAADGDTIFGFEPGDRVDLTAIDANLGAAGDQGFTLVSGAAFTAAGQLAVSFDTRADGDFTVVQGNIDGNTNADFKFEIAGHQNLTNGNLGL